MTPAEYVASVLSELATGALITSLVVVEQWDHLVQTEDVSRWLKQNLY